MGPAGHGETNGAIAASNAEDLETGAAAGNSAPASKEELLQELGVDAEVFQMSNAWRAGTEDAKSTRRANSMLDSVSKMAEMEGGASSVARLKRVIHVTLQWERLTYSVTVGRGKKRTVKTILDGISGHLEPGRLLAVMGPTGSGKTSLINALAGRLPRRAGRLLGDVLINGQPRSRGFRSITAYVLQDDVLYGTLTVRETFEFAAAIRLPAAVSKATRTQLVDDIISELALGKAADTFIGNAFMRGVSGGERKRTNIGVELLSNPSLLFLDEPTSGLDAFQAQNVMEALWTLSSNGRSVACTIHQPRSSIFRMFDQLMLLSEGRVMYFGAAAAAVAYFSQAGFVCPSMFNPGDFLIDVTSMDYRSPDSEALTRRRIQLLGDLYQRLGADTASEAVIGEESRRDIKLADKDMQFANNMLTEFSLLLGRAWRNSSRNRPLQVVTAGQTVIIGLLLAWLYSDMSPTTASGVQDEIGILFFVCIFSAMGAMFGALTTFASESGIIQRERASKSYHVLPYYLARFICDIPLRVGQGLLFGCILYWIVGLNPSAGAFFIFCALVLLLSLASQGLGVAISAATKNEKIAIALAPMVTVILILFGGFYVSVDSIPPVLRWIRYISHLYWGFMGFTINDFAGRTGWGVQGQISGDQVLDGLGFGSNHLWQTFLGLSLLIVGFNLLGYLLLRFTKPRYLPLANPPAKKPEKELLTQKSTAVATV